MENEAEELTIKVWYSETNEGYMYSIFNRTDDTDDADEDDGGVCTGSYKDAIEMAISQATGFEFGPAELSEKCQHCGDSMNGIVRVHHHTENGEDVTK